MGLIASELFDEFTDFSRQLLQTRDVDPQYYSLKGVSDLRGLSLNDRYDLCFIYYGFNHIISADRYFNDRYLDPINLSYGKNRRGFRGNRKVLDYLACASELRPHLLRAGSVGGEIGWSQIYSTLTTQVKGCGPWSGYCLTETFKVVMGFPVTAPDFGEVPSSERKTGPIAGVELLTGVPIATLMRDRSIHRQIYSETRSSVPWTGLEEMESALCNFMSLRKKTYYVGRDIDRQIPALQQASPDWWRAREIYFPDEMLGEKHGWSGPREDLMGHLEPGRIWR